MYLDYHRGTSVPLAAAKACRQRANAAATVPLTCTLIDIRGRELEVDAPPPVRHLTHPQSLSWPFKTSLGRHATLYPDRNDILDSAAHRILVHGHFGQSVEYKSERRATSGCSMSKRVEPSAYYRWLAGQATRGEPDRQPIVCPYSSCRQRLGDPLDSGSLPCSPCSAVLGCFQYDRPAPGARKERGWILRVLSTALRGSDPAIGRQLAFHEVIMNNERSKPSVFCR